MKLLVFHQALAPYRVDFFNHLAVRFDMELVLFDTNLVNQKFDQGRLVERLKCRVSYLLGGFRWKDRYFRMGAVRKIRQERPDVVLGCEYSLVTIAIALYRWVSRAKFRLYTMTDDNLIQFNARRGIKAALRWLFVRVFDGIIVTNDEVRLAYESITPRSSGIGYYVVPILHDEAAIRTDFEAIAAAGENWRTDNLPAFSKVALFVGRLDEVKNIRWLVEQFKNLQDIALVVLGSGALDEEIATIVKKDRLGNVVLVGRKEGRGVYEMMTMADALVLPSAFEPYGAVVGEALQWGTPCVVSDRVGSKDLINEKHGAVFPFGDSAAFEVALRKTLRLKAGHASLIDDELPRAMEPVLKSMGGS